MTTRSRRKNEKEAEDVPFVKNVEFRSNRGAGIKALLEKKQNESDSDDFWKNNKYFGNFNDIMNESEASEEYSQEPDLPDEFDEDFGDSDDDSDDEGEDEEDQGKNSRPSGLQLQITKNASANVKKFIDKDEKKKVTPAIAALKKSKAKGRAKTKQTPKTQPRTQVQITPSTVNTKKIAKEDAMEIETPPSIQQTIPSTRPRRELRSVTFVMESPERPEKTRTSEKTIKSAKLEAALKKVVTITFIVEAYKKNKRKFVDVQALLPAVTLAPKKDGPKKKTLPAKKMVVEQPIKQVPQLQQSDEVTTSGGRTTRGQEKRAFAEKTATLMVKAPTKGSKASKLKIQPTKNIKTTATTKTKQKVVVEEIPKKKGKYIHDFYTQEELMKEAALTEIYNKKSLENLLQLETDKKDSYMTMRRYDPDDSRVTFHSKKVNDTEETRILLSDGDAFQMYFGELQKTPSTNNRKRWYFEELDGEEENTETDVEEVIRKKLFLTNARYKLDEISRNIEKMELEEYHLEKTIDALKDILERKQEAVEV